MNNSMIQKFKDSIGYMHVGAYRIRPYSARMGVFVGAKNFSPLQATQIQ
jgi:hypothetical protein